MSNYFYNIKNYNEYRRTKFSAKRKYPLVDIEHRRVEINRKKTNPKGGMTIITLWIDKDCAITGIAFCCDKDTYNKLKGKSIAFGRLMRSAYKCGSKEEYLRRIRILVESKIGKINRFYFSQAYNGDEIK